MKTEQRAIWWIRRDLRLQDNVALSMALSTAREVIPVFVLDPFLLNSAYVGERRLAFLLAGLRRLDAALRERGSRLLILNGRPVEQLQMLVSASGSQAVYAEADVSPYARRRDAQVGQMLPLQLTAGLTVQAPGAVLKSDGQPYTVFTPFSRAWKALPQPGDKALVPAPAQIATPPDLVGVELPAEPAWPVEARFQPGAAAARQRLLAFTGGKEAGVYRYAQGRDRIDWDDTAHLSPYLRLGMISAREVVLAARSAIANAPDKEAEKGALKWLDELIWREFYIHILYHFPQVRRGSFRPSMAHFPWRTDNAALAAWQAGQTGYPIVDAAMRQLKQSGWMPNRARMIVASFLTKHLLVHWSYGERWFMQQLLDGDPAANNGGWQWTAGTGTDAAPYFRIFNPIIQGKKFDPDGRYVRRWLPELVAVPDKFIHTPWEMPAGIQRQAGCRIGRDYPEPIVEHSQARARALAALQSIKK